IALGPIVAHAPTRDSNRVLRITYVDGEGVLRRLLSEATQVGFSAFILGTRRQEDSNLVELDVRFKGRAPLRNLIPTLDDIEGVRSVRGRGDDSEDEEEAGA